MSKPCTPTERRILAVSWLVTWAVAVGLIWADSYFPVIVETGPMAYGPRVVSPGGSYWTQREFTVYRDCPGVARVSWRCEQSNWLGGKREFPITLPLGKSVSLKSMNPVPADIPRGEVCYVRGVLIHQCWFGNPIIMRPAIQIFEIE